MDVEPIPPPAATPPFRLREFNRKIPAPSLRMHPSDGNHYRCPWIEDSVTIHSDGNVTCGLDDPHGQRSFGNVYSQTIEEIFHNPEYGNLQTRLWQGERCTDCTLYTRETLDFSAPPKPRPAMPAILVVEPTVKCNIRCNNDACRPNNEASIRTRDSDMLRFEAFTAVIDQLAPGLKHVYFFNYGDPFVHARAEDMLLYLRRQCPDVRVVTSTNGIPLAKAGRAEKLVEACVNTIVFTIGGVTQESYARYHVNGKVDLALAGLRRVAEARNAAGQQDMSIVWRYLLFHWNDSVAEVEEALRIAKELGVDSFHLYLTHIPEGAASFRFAPGTPNFDRYRRYIDCALHYTRAVGLVEPDNNGLFPIENVEGLGPARWTGYRAELTCAATSGLVLFALATNNGLARDRPVTVFVVTPWATFKFMVGHLAWRSVVLRVPPAWRAGSVRLTLATPDHWFPAEALGTTDKRCLGVLVRAEETAADWVAALNSRAVADAGEPLTDDDTDIVARLVPARDPVAPLQDRTNGGRMQAL